LLQKAIDNFALYKSAGMTENYENYNWFARPEWTEPCAIVDSYMVTMQLWEETQNVDYLNDAHLIYYNAIAHTQRANGGFGCDNCPTGTGEHSLKVHEIEAWWCCTMRGGEGLASAINYSYYNQSNTLTIPSYHNSELKNGAITVTQQTDYPNEGNVKLEFIAPEAFNIPLKLFIPEWATNFTVKSKDKDIPFETDNGFATLNVSGEKSLTLQINFVQELKVRKNINTTNNLDTTFSFMSGPLMLGYRNSGEEINFTGTPKITKKTENKWEVSDGEQTHELTPVYHLLDAEVAKDNGYRKQIIF
jgi:DUF1680 family protein